MRIASQIPIQSDYLPLVSVYFFLSILFTFLSLVWFVTAEFLKNKKFNSKFLIKMTSRFNISNRVLKLKKTQTNTENSTEISNHLEIDVSLVNKLAFSLMSFSMFVSYLTIWLGINN